MRPRFELHRLADSGTLDRRARYTEYATGRGAFWAWLPFFAEDR
jgi:hypothetical protein